MTKIEIEEYLAKLEDELLIESERHSIELTSEWAKSFPEESAVYLFREDCKVCYVGETGSLRGRMFDIRYTKNHTLRRNLGNHHYFRLPNYEKPSSKKGFSHDIEIKLDDKIQKHLTLSYITISLGRKELEERLFDKLKPEYNLQRKKRIPHQPKHPATKKN